MLYIDINVKTGEPPVRLPVHKGDTPDDLVRVFCESHSVSETVQDQLVHIFA